LKRSADVAIIGYGPVGATLANILGGFNVSTVVIERDETAYSLPRAVHFDDEVMRCFQSIGLAREIAADCHVNPGMLFVDNDGRVLVDWSRPMEIGPLCWHASYRFHQPDLERVLRRGANRYSNVTVLPGYTVTGLRQSGTTVDIEAANSATGEPLSLSAGFVVGCDGARSMTRAAIGSGFEDLGFNERWLVVDLILENQRADLGDYSIQHCDPDTPATYVRGTGQRRRWEFRLDPETGDEEATKPESVWKRLQKWLTPADASLERAAVYTFRSRLAQRWRQGNIFIAGDAAHQTPPFMGQGMCAGIRDAANLGWKLARVVENRSGDTLLDTYQSERAVHARAYIEMAVAMGQLINKTAVEKLVDAESLQSGEAKRIASIRPPLGPGLSQNRPDGINRNRDAEDLAGHLAPQFFLADGALSDAKMHNKMALFVRHECEAEIIRTFGARLKDLDIGVIADKDPALQDWLAGKNADAILVRPDGYVMATTPSPTGIAGILDKAPSL